jgi:hypothetical protein
MSVALLVRVYLFLLFLLLILFLFLLLLLLLLLLLFSFFFFLFSFFFFLFRFFCVALLAPQTARVQNDTFLIISQLLFNGVSVFGASAGGISPPAMCLITQNNFA